MSWSFLCGLLILFTTSCALLDVYNPLIKPKQLMIGTVVDTTNAEIVRDAVNMIKTMRLFGGTLNEATLVVGITGEVGSNLDDGTISAMVALGASIIFIPQTPPDQAKTLNKFRLFEAFDSTTYDYFLWLDADLVIFQDPLPFLHMHQYPGSIECVPDFYSYLRRYPRVNTSAEYWNADLPSFSLLGDGETAPHGICNTGVLYFDSQSLSRFLGGLQSVLQNATYMTQHGADRFVDSLIFTRVVNTLGIEVTVLPHALNYMALFEIEIQEELTPRPGEKAEEIVMAHMLSDTELYCTTTLATTTSTTTDGEATDGEVNEEEPPPSPPLPECLCMYRNKLMSPAGSQLRDTIQRRILSDPAVCRILAAAVVAADGTAGSHLLPSWPGRRVPQHTVCDAPAVPNQETVEEEEVNGDRETPLADASTPNPSATAAKEGDMELIGCVLVSPPSHNVTLHVGAERTTHLDILLRCRRRHDGGGVSKSYHGDGTTSAAPSLEQEAAMIMTTTLVNTVYDASAGVVHASRVTATLHESGSSAEGSDVDVSYTLAFTPTAPLSGPAYTALHTLAIQQDITHATQATQPTTVVLATATVTVVFDQRIPPGQVHYSMNPALTAKPAALASQLYLAEHLNDRSVRGTGVVACCGSHKGVATVTRLIRHWQGDHLLILVETAPSLSPTVSNASESVRQIAELRQKLHSICQASNLVRSRPLHCFVTTPPRQTLAVGAENLPSYARQIAHALRPRSAQFVYLDNHRTSWGKAASAETHCEHVAALQTWMRVLAKGGVLMSSAYAPPLRREIQEKEDHAGWESESGRTANTVSATTILHHGEDISIKASSWSTRTHIAHDNANIHFIIQQALLLRLIDVHLRHARFAADTLALEATQNLQLTYAERDPSQCRQYVRAHMNLCRNRNCSWQWQQQDGQGQKEREMITKIKEVEEEVSEAWAKWECSPAWFLHKLRGN